MVADSLIGQVVGGYKVESEMGRGAMGVVYKARDVNLHRVVALKVLAQQLVVDATFVKRFIREARSVAQLSHPNIVTVYQAGEHQGVYFIAMEYVEGRTLAEAYRLPGRVDVAKALDITLQVSKALVAAHAKGIVHHDINPRNIMADETGRVRVLDFGLARLLEGGAILTSEGSSPGTPAYMAPEQVDGEAVDQRTDIYSLGATLYEMLTGHVPYHADTPLAVMRAISEKPFPILSLNDIVPHAVVQLVSKMTNRNPNYRYPSAEALCRDIGHLLKDPSAIRTQFILDAKAREEIVAGPQVDFEETTAAVEAEPAVPAPEETPATVPPWIPEEPPRPAGVPETAAKALAHHTVSPRTLIVGAALVLTIAAIVAGMSLFGGRGPAAKGEWVSLFNGQDLTGWRKVHEAKSHPGFGEWSVRDGAIATTAQKSLLRTVGEWRDFEFEVDYKSQEGSLTSIWLRGRVPLQVHNSGPGFAPDRRPGAIRDQYPPLVDATKPDGEWNHLRVRLEGYTLIAHLNGKLIQDGARGVKVWRESPLGGNVTDDGPIMLESWHGVTFYKNLRIRPVESAQPQREPAQVASVPHTEAANMVIQQGNNAPGFHLLPEPSQSLADNHIGVWFETYDKHDTDFVYSNGFKRMRIGGLFGSNQVKWPIREDTLTKEVDDVISAYAENGVTIMLSIQPGSGLRWPIDEFTQADIDILLEYTRFVATHFKGRIAYYEIWNEFGNIYKINTYANLVAKATEVIKDIDPDARVIMGAVPGDWLNDYPGYGEYQRFILNTKYLFELIRIMNFEEVKVDGISWHPLYDNIPEDPYYQGYPELVQKVQKFAASRGFTGEYFADEILWHTYDEPDWDNGPPVSQLTAAKYYARTITEHRGLGVNVTINTFFQAPFLAPIQNLNDVLAGAEPTDTVLSLKTSEAVKNLRIYAFTVSDGNMLVALWTNGAAVKEDRGVSSTLTISNASANNVIGIDVLHGFKQELVTENVDRDLVIHALMIKDYPIIIKFSNTLP